MVERALRAGTLVMGDEAQLQRGNLLVRKDVILHKGMLVTTAPRQ